jgi:hypothetical protein
MVFDLLKKLVAGLAGGGVDGVWGRLAAAIAAPVDVNMSRIEDIFFSVYYFVFFFSLFVEYVMNMCLA